MVNSSVELRRFPNLNAHSYDTFTVYQPPSEHWRKVIKKFCYCCQVKRKAVWKICCVCARPLWAVKVNNSLERLNLNFRWFSLAVWYNTDWPQYPNLLNWPLNQKIVYSLWWSNNKFLIKWKGNESRNFTTIGCYKIGIRMLCKYQAVIERVGIRSNLNTVG